MESTSTELGNVYTASFIVKEGVIEPTIHLGYFGCTNATMYKNIQEAPMGIVGPLIVESEPDKVCFYALHKTIINGFVLGFNTSIQSIRDIASKRDQFLADAKAEGTQIKRLD